MKTTKLIIFFLLIAFTGVAHIYAQDSSSVKNKDKVVKKQALHNGGNGFVDEDGDGYNDNAPDHDGDGIPNGLDPDYQGPGKSKRFVDLDGDGIDDNIMSPMSDNGFNEQNNAIGPQNGNKGQSEQGMQQKSGSASGKRKRGGNN
ncbi:MAG: hypothetical protein KDF60_08140 [Calditrichaeota bacterium]|nr:hypothetical protein [Calditrichota bacterium]